MLADKHLYKVLILDKVFYLVKLAIQIKVLIHDKMFTVYMQQVAGSPLNPSAHFLFIALLRGKWPLLFSLAKFYPFLLIK